MAKSPSAALLAAVLAVVAARAAPVPAPAVRLLSSPCAIAETDATGAPRALSCNGTRFARPDIIPEGTRTWYRDLLFALTCVLCAAFAAGLTLGLTSLDEFGLRVLCNRSVSKPDELVSETAQSIKAKTRLLDDQRCARRILPLVSGRLFGDDSRCPCNPTNGHVLLVTLLLTNAAANEALPLFLDRLVPSWLAILLSVTVVLIFGEIVPSAIFIGPHQLKLAAALSPIVRVGRLALLPLVGPISLVLDAALGGHVAEEEDRREAMKAMATTISDLRGLEHDEVNMIHGVLEMHAKTANQISKPLDKAKMLAHDDVLSEDIVQDLLRWGHSRVFVYRRDPKDPARRDEITSVLLVKKLLGFDLKDGRRVDSIEQALRKPVVLSLSDNLLSALNKFQAGMCHLAVVSPQPDVLAEALSEVAVEQACAACAAECAACAAQAAESAGAWTPVEARPVMFCSMEDVIEAVLKEDIFDEADEELGRCPAPTLLRSGTSGTRLSAIARLSRYGSPKNACMHSRKAFRAEPKRFPEEEPNEAASAGSAPCCDMV